MSTEITRSTYDAAHSYFDAAPLRFWERHGERTVERLGLRAGSRILDVCSGTGASALAAARIVG
jgi:ubiquinone/menaquinone biosynthesis C-methylase UbiE